jgi:hypothetical protein
MKRLEVNFAAGAAPSPWLARVLAVAALVLLVDTGLAYRDTRMAIAAHEAAIAERQPRHAAARKVPDEELAAVRDTVERIGMPWEHLFHALESAASADVALLGIEPDIKAGTVVISGDGKSYLAALGYVHELGRSPALSRVQLLRHEAKDAQGAVRFAVSAAWKEARP